MDEPEDRLALRIADIARELARELHPEQPGLQRLGPDASIERDFNLDSLALMELASRIDDACATRLSESAMALAETPRDLARAVRSAKQAAPGAVQADERRAVPPPALGAAAAGKPALPAATTLLDALEWHATEQPDRTHILLVDPETAPAPISFRELREAAIAVAAGLHRTGVRRGETVAIMLPTGREFFAAFYGTLYAQAIPVPLYPPARPGQIENHLQRLAGILANCEAKVLLTFERAKRVAYLLRSLDTRLERIATPDEIAEHGAPGNAPKLRADDIAFLQYTSGSTGRPKGVVLTHANLLANIQAMQRATGVTSADCFVSWLPLYHDMGLIGACIGALLAGYPLVLMSPFSFLAHPAHWLRTVHRYRGTITAAPNFAFELCLNKIADREILGLDLSGLRMIFNGAEAVSAQTLERFAARFSAYGLRSETLMPVYGLAECALGLTFPPVGRGPLIDAIDRTAFLRSGIAKPAEAADPAPLRIVSCGRPLPGHAIRIVDTAGDALPERAQGRIEFRGPSATSGYFHNPEETSRLFHGEWLDTGDLGYLANGELFVSGRAKDIIVRAGHHIHPQELEEAVAQLKGVRRGGVAVFPATDRRHGTERVVVLAETREQDAQARSSLVERIHRLAVDLIGLPIDEVVLAPPRTVLKTSSGKIRRAACREAYERGELSAAQRAPWIQLARLGYRAFTARSTRAASRLARDAWGCWALLVAGCLAPFLWLTLMLTPGLLRRRRAAAAFVRLAGRLCAVPLVPTGTEHIAGGPQVFVANHASYLDGVVLLATLPAHTAFVVKRELAHAFALGSILKRLGCVFIERHDVQEAVAGARDLRARLQAGESLMVFAEGTFMRDPGLLPFHMGAFSTAAAAGVPVVPVALRGTRAMLPSGAVLPHRARIEVIFGAPLAADDAGWSGALGLRQRTRRHILAHIAEPDLE